MRILVATGGSPHSEVAVRFAAALAGAINAELTIITVSRRSSERARAEHIVAEAAARVRTTVPDVFVRVRVGHSAEEIVKEVDEGQFDLLVVGEKQHHDIVTRFLVGATAERVVEHASCPVIIAKGRPGLVRRILLCDSGMREPSLLGRFIDQMGQLLQAGTKITVLHVMSQISAAPGIDGQQLRASAAELIAARAPEGLMLEYDLHVLQDFSGDVEPKVRHGRVVDEILAEAREGSYDLVVIGAHRGEGWRRILLDDLAHQVIVKVDRPILTLR